MTKSSRRRSTIYISTGLIFISVNSIVYALDIMRSTKNKVNISYEDYLGFNIGVGGTIISMIVLAFLSYLLTTYSEDTFSSKNLNKQKKTFRLFFLFWIVNIIFNSLIFSPFKIFLNEYSIGISYLVLIGVLFGVFLFFTTYKILK